MMRTSRCPDDDNRTPNRQPYMPTASSPRSRSPVTASSLVSLTVVVVVAAVAGLPGPVQAGMMDFSAPDVIQYGTCAQPKDQQPFDFRQVSAYLWRGELGERAGNGEGEGKGNPMRGKGDEAAILTCGEKDGKGGKGKKGRGKGRER